MICLKNTAEQHQHKGYFILFFFPWNRMAAQGLRGNQPSKQKQEGRKNETAWADLF